MSDFERQCPLVKKDFLGEANSLLAALVAQQTALSGEGVILGTLNYGGWEQSRAVIRPFGR